MRVLKVFNNNVVLAVDEHDGELVLFGRGLGFKAAPGSPVDPGRVERRFVPGASASADRIAAMVQEIPPQDIELAQRLVDLARTRLGQRISDHVLLPLADHLSFALRRAAQGVAEIEYPLRWEVQYLYPAEVAVAREMLALVTQERGVPLPDVETVPLALHLVNAQFDADMSATAQMTADLHRILDIIREEYGVRIDETSMEVARFVTHLRYLFLREQQGRMLTETPAELHAALRSARPREYTSAGRIGTLLAEQYGWAVSTDEILYLALHVSRLVDAAAAADRQEGATR
ncbi:PRD domain-containing protein [Nakamurella sp.]|uniref:PRD domain-containing protein n=1 Tax=Nakamurella sp. TaxID=1869182 RepID=UPI003B3A1CDA